MSELSWYAVIPPRNLDAAALTAALRTLASRPRIGLLGRTPTVVFELWGQAGEVGWWLGLEERIADELTQQLKAHLPRLGLVHEPTPQRSAVMVATTLNHRGFIHPLRTDMAEQVATALQDTLRGLKRGEAAVVQWLVGPAKGRAREPQSFRPLEILGLRERPAPDASVRREWRSKAAEPLLECVGRIGAVAARDKQARAILRRLAGGVALANSSHATLYPRRPNTETARALNEALPPFMWSSLLSAAELAVVLGWPVQEDVADDLPVVGGHIGVVPEKLLITTPTQASKERILGESLHPAQRGQLVRMPASCGPYHLHLIGPTGSGKSTLLTHLILADIAAGRGVLVLEPRGDLVTDILARIPEERQADVVVIDPADAQAYGSVGLNVLAGPIETAERRADELVALLAAMAGSNWGPRTADVALHAILTVSKLDGGVLPDVVALLTNPTFRRSVIGKVSDPLVLGPWWAAYDAMSDGERGQHIAPLLRACW